MPKALTLKHVATEAGVSMKTVSRVINGSSEVTDETRQKVERVINELDYHPNRLARSLASGKTNTVGVLVHHSVKQTFEYPFFNELLEGIGVCLNQSKFDMLLRFINSENLYAELYDQRRVDGLIIMNAPINNTNIDRLIERQIPCVFTSRISLENNRSHWVDSDFSDGTQKLVHYLLGLGHRRIGLLAGPETLALAHLRIAGYRAMHHSQRISVPEDLITYSDLFLTPDTVSRLVHTWLKSDDPPTAIIASDDLTATSLIHALEGQGYRVPRDVSVTGWDDTLLAHTATPRLTSVGQKGYEKGYLAASRLIEVMSGATDSPIQINLEMELIVRDSSGPVLDMTNQQKDRKESISS